MGAGGSVEKAEIEKDVEELAGSLKGFSADELQKLIHQFRFLNADNVKTLCGTDSINVRCQLNEPKPPCDGSQAWQARTISAHLPCCLHECYAGDIHCLIRFGGR